MTLARIGRSTAPVSHVSPHLLDVLDGWQRGFPLVARPFAAIGRACGLSEGEVLLGLSEMQRAGVLGRVGATIRPNTIGVSLLAAMKVPEDRLEEVARIVNAEPGVNHNYEREHDINLWFVIAAPDSAKLDASLDRIRMASGLDVLELPLERAYYIDLGFPLRGQDGCKAGRQTAVSLAPCDLPKAASQTLGGNDRRLLEVLERGLMLVPRPFLALGAEIGLSEAQVIARIANLIASGVITRFGLIIRHRRLGYRANAMVVFDVEDDRVDALGEQFAREDFVTLCYRRPRHGARWPYNLFCMIHGLERERVAEQAWQLAQSGDIGRHAHAVLFSRRCFLQRGTRIAHANIQREAAQ
ncbi:MAG TPA: AsnC family transcriptional regulator [Hyphomicrobiaceae bacterium]|nr:AsnC family transcriptional regulator [Hyphomicrobiaceae bacterium]